MCSIYSSLSVQESLLSYGKSSLHSPEPALDFGSERGSEKEQ